MRLLDDVYYYNREEEKWKQSFIISVIKNKFNINGMFNRYLVAGYGPSLPPQSVLPENDYIRLVDTRNIDLRTELAQKSR